MAKTSEVYLGARFGRLTVIGESFLAGSRPDGKRDRWVNVRCACGTEKNVLTTNLGRTTSSCGCLQRELAKQQNTTHGMTVTPEYRTWRAMVARCTNPNGPDWTNYGGRGVTVCPEWVSSFEAFYADMGPRPEGTSIDRIDNTIGYTRANCRWASAAEQTRNRRTITKLNAEQVATIKQQLRAGGRTSRAIAAEYGVGPSAIANIKAGNTWADVEPATS